MQEEKGEEEEKTTDCAVVRAQVQKSEEKRGEKERKRQMR